MTYAIYGFNYSLIDIISPMPPWSTRIPYIKIKICYIHNNSIINIKYIITNKMYMLQYLKYFYHKYKFLPIPS